MYHNKQNPAREHRHAQTSPTAVTTMKTEDTHLNAEVLKQEEELVFVDLATVVLVKHLLKQHEYRIDLYPQ